MLDITGKPFPDMARFATWFAITDCDKDQAIQIGQAKKCDAIRFGIPGSVAIGYHFRDSDGC